MKKWAVLALGASLFLGACGDSQTGSPAEVEAEAQAETKPVAADAKGTVEEGGWLKYRSAEWAGEHNGLKINVNSVSFAPDLGALTELPELDGQAGAVVWTTFENPTDETITVDGIGTKLITDDGYEVEVSGYITDDFVSEIRPGTKKEADLGFILSGETDPRAVESVTAVFRVLPEGVSYMYEDVEAQIQLK